MNTNAFASTDAGRGIAALGPVMQLAFVPRDFDAAVNFWTRTIGAGPFYLREHIQADTFAYRGDSTPIDFDAAIGYWGDLQIELIRQHDDTPSIFRNSPYAHRDGLHHVCIAVDDMTRARSVCASLDADVLQEATFRGGAAEIVYVDTGGGPGTLVELWRGDDAGRAYFARARDVHRSWDGNDPLRRQAP